MSGEQDREALADAAFDVLDAQHDKAYHVHAAECCWAFPGVTDALANLIAQAEQRGREDNERHDMCYVHGSKALAEHEQRGRVEALREAAFDLRDRRDRVGSIALPADAAFATCIDLLTTRADRIEADS